MDLRTIIAWTVFFNAFGCWANGDASAYPVMDGTLMQIAKDSNSTARPVIATTVHSPDFSFEQWLEYHHSIGFQHVFVFLDNSDEVDPDLVRKGRDWITVIPNDEKLLRLHERTPLYAGYGAFRESEVMARQVMNTQVAIDLARERGFDWLMHMDCDEMFYPTESTTVDDHFQMLNDMGIAIATYMNYEAVPEYLNCNERHGWKCFTDIVLWRRNLWLLKKGTQQNQRGMAEYSQPRKGWYHVGFNVGKTAVNVNEPGVAVFDVTKFTLQKGSKAGVAAFDGPVVLHYINTNFPGFQRKYDNTRTEKWKRKSWLTGLSFDRSFVDPKFLVNQTHFPKQSKALPFHKFAFEMLDSGEENARNTWKNYFVVDDERVRNKLYKSGVLTDITFVKNTLTELGLAPADDDKKKRKGGRKRRASDEAEKEHMVQSRGGHPVGGYEHTTCDNDARGLIKGKTNFHCWLPVPCCELINMGTVPLRAANN